MTNGDIVRQMTDEELARGIGKIICMQAEGCDLENNISCYYCRLRWLKQEAIEGGQSENPAIT